MDYYSVVEEYDLYPDFTLPVDERSGLETSLSYLFDDIDLQGKRVLDIGAGDGTYSIYMACQGADVLALEPEAEGAREGEMLSTLTTLANEHDRLTIEPITFQEFETEEEFDLVFMHNVVNHLDEDACIRLQESEQARDQYRMLFEKLYGIVAPGGILLLADADRTHFYQFIGLDHPLASNIEWEKHQPPSIWFELLEQAGFRKQRLGWTPAASLGPLAPLTSNYIISHFLRSHFCLIVERAR